MSVATRVGWLWLGLLAPAGAEVVLHVSPLGRDTWSGRLAAPRGDDGPFATLQRAQQAVRQMRAQQPDQAVKVWLRGGRYELAETLLLGPADSGTAAAPVVWAAWPGEQPVLSGGRRLSGWQPRGAEQVLRRPEFGDWSFRQLYLGPQRLTRARHPSVDASDPNRRGFTYVAPDPGALSGVVGNIHNPGDWMEYLVEVPAAGEYDVWLFYGHKMLDYQVPDMGGRSMLSIDGGPAVPLLNLPDTGGWGPVRWARCAKVSLAAGQRVVRWTNQVGGGFGLAGFLLSDDPAYQPSGTSPAPAAAGRHAVIIAAEKFRASQGKQLSVSSFPGGGSKDTLPCLPGVVQPSWRASSGAEVHIWPSDPNSCRAFKLIIDLTAADPAAGTLRVAGPECIVSFFPGDRFFVENLPDALDSPGEWYLDRAASELRLRPPVGADLATVVAPRLRQLVRSELVGGRGLEHLRLEGLTFCETDYAPGDGGIGYGMGQLGTVHLAGARDVTLRDCHFALTGLYAVAAADCQAVRVERCQIRDSAQGGVLLRGSAGCTVSDCQIERLGAVYKHIGGVVLEGAQTSDNVVEHNLIRDSSRYGISLKNAGLRNRIEFNRVERTSLETYDTGAIEVTQGDRQQLSGSLIRGNVVADSVGYSSRFEQPQFLSWGIYLDSFAGGYTVTGNLCYRSHNGGIMLQGGRENVVTHNTLVDGNLTQLHFANFADNTRGSRFEQNIVVARDPASRLLSRGRLAPEVLRADRNLFWQPGRSWQAAGGEWERWRAVGYDEHGQIADPLLVDAAHDDYRLQPGSPAAALGIDSTAWQQAGPRPR
ncbi:MAG: right-handed parallel beta-helix repeat-containing protein [Fimbriimonadaceae bacterium]|nr:right-handed parallel beta-helix repeat-containing protein [Fimbriimonadaceae bacterium]